MPTAIPKEKTKKRRSRKGERIGGGKLAAADRKHKVQEHRERAFALAFLQHGCARKAVNAAGLKAKSNSTAWGYLRKPLVQKIIQEEMAARAKDAGITAERVLRLVINGAEAAMKDYATWTEGHLELIPSEQLTREQTRNIKKISMRPSKFGTSVSIELYNAMDARRLLMQYLKLIGPESAAGERPEARETARRIRELLAQPLAQAREGK